MKQIRQVALLIDTSTDYSSHLIEGVARYARTHRPWDLLVQPRGEHERTLMPRYWKPDGVIVRMTHRAMAKDLLKRKIPLVNVSLSQVKGYEFPQVTIDELMLGRLAAKHFQERGLRQFGYLAIWRQQNYVDHCGPAYAEELQRLVPECTVHIPRARETAPHSMLTAVDLRNWLKRLPKPIGIFAVDAEDAHNLADACRALNIHVPNQVAILVGEDDRLLCEISHPPLSAIDLGSERIGYEAAAVLDQLMSRRKRPLTPKLFPPQRIITRLSTDMLAMNDQELADALRMIRQHVFEPLTVSDILKQIPISRRTLELRFQRVLGISPAAEIRQVRIERAKVLLTTTNLSIPEVAAASGFNHVEVMNRLFQRMLNLTPTQYRRAGAADSSSGR